MRRVTIQDLAKELNLSRNTVAKALANSETVAYETRRLVVDKACEMGYHKISQNVVKELQKAQPEEVKNILVLAMQDVSLFWNSIIAGVTEGLNRNNCRLRFAFISKEEEKRVQLPADYREDLDGIILTSVFSKEYLEAVLRKQVPVVCLDISEEEYEMNYPVDVVMSEGMRSVSKITEKLISQGLKKIGFIGDITYSKSLVERYMGYHTAMVRADLKMEKEFLAISHKPERYYVYQEVEDYINSLEQLPEAFVCANDAIAFLTIRALREKGLSVPQDIAVTGFDNQEDMVQMGEFLTTVKVINQKLGERLAKQMMFRLANPDQPSELIFVGTEVIFRTSSEFVANKSE